MVKQIISDTFEQLGQTAKQGGQQMAKVPGELAEKAATQIGTKPGTGVEQPQGQGPTLAQIVQKKEKASRRLSYLEQELAVLRQRQAQELPKQTTGQEGFSKEKAIKQIELQKEQQKELPPAVAQAKKKGGSGERKLMGGSG